MRPIYSWDLGRYLGSIPEPATTYNVMGNANDQGLVIGETTLGGLKELSNVGKDHRNGTILDYGQLIWVTLQRAATGGGRVFVGGGGEESGWKEVALVWGGGCSDPTALHTSNLRVY